MNSIKHRFTLDMHSSQSQVCIPAKLGDTNRSLHINLSEGGKPYFIETGSLAMVTIKRPTGTHLTESCNIKNNSTVVYHFAHNVNTCAVEGLHECELVLYGPDGEQIASPRFSMLVSERVVRSDDINLEDDDRNAIDAMFGAEASRQEGEKGRVDAEAIRVAAEEGRVTAEATRVSAEESRVNAEKARATNADQKISDMDAKIAELNKKVADGDFDGRDGTVRFEELTEEQIAMLRVDEISKGSGDYSLVVGTDDTSVLGELESKLGDDFKAKKPEANGNLSLSHGMSTEANSVGATAMGFGTIAGVSGYYWYDISISGNTAVITLSKNQGSLGLLGKSYGVSLSEIDWKVGDYISIVNNQKYAFCAKITKIETVSLTPTVYTYDTVAITVNSSAMGKNAYSQTLVLSPDDKTIFAVGRTQDTYTLAHKLIARNGIVELAWGAIAIGLNNLSLGTFGVVFGANNVLAGDFGAVFGRDNLGAYGNLICGGWNESKGLHSGLIGRLLKNYGNYNFLTNYNNTINKGVCNAVFGYGNTVNGGESSGVFGEQNTVNGNFNFLANYKNKVESGERNTLHGKENTVKGNNNFTASSTVKLAGDCNGVFGWSHSTNGDGNAISGMGHSLGDVDKGYKVHYSTIDGEGHKVGTDLSGKGGDNTIRWCDVAGYQHEINHSGVFARGGKHKSSYNYQTLLGFGSTEDENAALILAYNGNLLTMGRAGTRSGVGTDAVTVQYLNDTLANYSGGGSGGGTSGVGIDRIEVDEATSDYGPNIINIVLTDGTQKQFVVRNGSKGSDFTYDDFTPEQLEGLKGKTGVGIANIEQTNTSNVDGGVNVLTITLTNGVTTTFRVKNGSAGSGSGGGSGENTAVAEDAANRAEEARDQAREAKIQASNYYTLAIEEAGKAEVCASSAQGYAEAAQAAQELAYSSEEHAKDSEELAKGYKDVAEIAKNEALGYASAADTARSVAQTYVSHAEGHASLALGYAQSAERFAKDANTAKSNAETAKNDAVKAQKNAETAASDAWSAEGAANGHAFDASTFAGIASDQSALAKKYKEDTEGIKATVQEAAAEALRQIGEAEYDIRAIENLVNAALETANTSATRAGNAATRAEDAVKNATDIVSDNLVTTLNIFRWNYSEAVLVKTLTTTCRSPRLNMERNGRGGVTFSFGDIKLLRNDESNTGYDLMPENSYAYNDEILEISFAYVNGANVSKYLACRTPSDQSFISEAMNGGMKILSAGTTYNIALWEP